MTKDEAMRLALEAFETWMQIDTLEDAHTFEMITAPEAMAALRQALDQPDPFSRLVRIMGTFDLSTGHADNWNDLLDSLESELRDVLGHYREAFKVEQKCSAHPDAPHGFNRDASHGLGRYVCDCEGWEPSDDDAAWAKHLKEPMSEKRVHESDTMERHVSYVCPQCHWTLEQQYDQTALELCDVCGWKTLIPDEGCLNCERGKPLVGLTNEEIQDLGYKAEKFDKSNSEWFDRFGFARAIEAKLREKNGF